MKIIGGKNSGLSILTNKRLPYRPIQSRIRKSVFDILSPFEYKKVLDLYSGSGIFGFESMSRGAERITFIDKSLPVIKLLKKNIEKLNNGQYQVIRKDVELFLGSDNNKYDLIFADPPYGSVDYKILFSMCIEKLSKIGKFVLEMDNNHMTFEGSNKKIYGDTQIIFYPKI